MSQYFKYQDQSIAVGDTVQVHQEIAEGEKKRVQIFEGTIIAVKGRENGRSFTVRRISAGGIGVEKILPISLPTIKKIIVKRRGQVRRSKLYYLRDKVGKKATKVREKAVNHKTAPAS